MLHNKLQSLNFLIHCHLTIATPVARSMASALATWCCCRPPTALLETLAPPSSNNRRGFPSRGLWSASEFWSEVNRPVTRKGLNCDLYVKWTFWRNLKYNLELINVSERIANKVTTFLSEMSVFQKWFLHIVVIKYMLKLTVNKNLCSKNMIILSFKKLVKKSDWKILFWMVTFWVNQKLRNKCSKIKSLRDREYCIEIYPGSRKKSLGYFRSPHTIRFFHYSKITL